MIDPHFFSDLYLEPIRIWFRGVIFTGDTRKKSTPLPKFWIDI